MSRFASRNRVYYIEEPIYHTGPDGLSMYVVQDNLFVFTPKLDNQQFHSNENLRVEKLLENLLCVEDIQRPVLWYYTPMALLYSSFIDAALVIYDCMDELSAFLHAPAELPRLENDLFCTAQIVFTGGKTLYYAKRNKHPNVHLFPSAIDKDHFAKARQRLPDPHDQASIPALRFGFFGVIDERFDAALISNAALLNPTWQFILIGPVVKIDPQSLPKADNIHYLGMKSYSELPNYIANWNVALIPFALNEATKYISPTKTPEYLAAGIPVISSAITDVQDPYGHLGLVQIVQSADEFKEAGEYALTGVNRENWLSDVDHFLRDKSWNDTWGSMNSLIERQLIHKNLSHNTHLSYV